MLTGCSIVNSVTRGFQNRALTTERGAPVPAAPLGVGVPAGVDRLIGERLMSSQVFTRQKANESTCSDQFVIVDCASGHWVHDQVTA